MLEKYPSSYITTNLNEKGEHNIAAQVFGNRFLSDQTLYEYLIEFLLVFVSAKSDDKKSGKMKFHQSSSEKLEYWVEPRMGLRRFIFFDKTKKAGVANIDVEAYNQIKRIICKSIEVDSEDEKIEIVEALQDLIHGYAVVIQKRSWCAQMLLPICPEMIFCDAMPNQKERKKLKWDSDDIELKIDRAFDFDKHSFLARGGEVYYLHILQNLERHPEKTELLEKLIKNLIAGRNNKLSLICNIIQQNWQEEMNIDEKSLYKKLNMGFIPKSGYLECGEKAVDELINFLSSDFEKISKIDILAKGVMLQVLRMMSWRIDDYLQSEKKKWIIDMCGGKSITVKKIAHKSFRDIEDGFLTALNRAANEFDYQEIEFIKNLKKAKNNTLDMFKAKGKELQCIIPSNGKYERFTLSEDVVKFLVLSLIPPRKKMTLKMFLEKLYDNYGFVIGPDEYKKAVCDKGSLEINLSNSFIENMDSFQAFLKATGFLRELSDATSIVVNPYNNVMEDY